MNKELPTQPATVDSPINTAQSPEALRRDFLKRFGSYASTAPLVTFTVFSAFSSKAIASGGVGGGEDDGG